MSCRRVTPGDRAITRLLPEEGETAARIMLAREARMSASERAKVAQEKGVPTLVRFFDSDLAREGE